jgi:uncharacterized protein
LFEQLKMLEELQVVDLELGEAEAALNALPAHLKSMKENLSRIEALLEKERGRLTDVEKYRRELGQGLDSDRQQLEKTRVKLAAIKTSREYMALQREYETNRRVSSEREQEIAKLDSAIEETKKSITQHEQELEVLRQQVTEEEQSTAAEVERVEGQVSSQRERRKAMSEKVPNHLLRKYEQIRKARGVALAMAVNGVCTGCRMQLPPQLYRILQRPDSIEQCPVCQRILHFPRPDAVVIDTAANGVDGNAPAH